MEEGIIEVDPRHTARRMKTAMQGDVIRALVELITNSDDSYTRLESENKPCRGVIEIICTREGRCATFSVRDFAEGMSIEDVRSSFKKYGGATSGMKAGKRVRGYFGQGAKDALVNMVDGKICTFKEDMFVQCDLFFKDNNPMYKIGDTVPATAELRRAHNIGANGTVAYFKADPDKGVSVPRFNTIHQRLANTFHLRRIMSNSSRKVFLWDKKRDERRRLFYRKPKGQEILHEDFKVSYHKYGDFPVEIEVLRAQKELSQIGDERDGGLILLDEEDVVLDLSLFKYDNEPLAARFFGEVKIGRFRELLEKEEPVLSEERVGLVRRHPFCQKLIEEIEKRLGHLVEEEKLRRQKQDQTKIGREEATRYRKAFRMLNEIAEQEAEAVTILGDKRSDELEEPPNGFCLYPPSAEIAVGKRYAFELRLNTEVVPHGSVVKVTCRNPKIQVHTSEIPISAEDGGGILSKYITIEGTESGIEGIIQACVKERISAATVFVVPPKDELLGEGMVFQPQSLTLRPNQPRKVQLVVYVKIIEGGSVISIHSENDSIHVSKNKIVVNEADALKHVAMYEMVIWGDQVDQNGVIVAECDTWMALMEVRIRSKEEKERKGRKGLFKEPEFSNDPQPLQRTSYSPETGQIIIYVNFPSVKHYLGENCLYRKTLPAQVFAADLMAERCFHEIARKKVESSGAILRPEAKADRIQRDAYELSRKYGKKVHEALVDQKLLKEGRTSENA